TTVFIPDASAAVVPIVQLGPSPPAIIVRAIRTQRVSVDVDSRTAFGIRTRRHRTATRPRATKVSVVVNDSSDAAVIVVERPITPAATHAFAAGAETVAVDADVSASFAIGAAWAVPPTSVSVAVTIPARICATQLAVHVGDRATATAEPIELGLHPITVHGFAF